MEVRRTFVAVNAISIGLLITAGMMSGSLAQTFWPTPQVASVAGVDSSIEAGNFLKGVPLRIRSGRPISVSLNASRSSVKAELLVRSSRLRADGTRKAVLLMTPGEQPASSVRTAFASGVASFIYVSDDKTTRNDVLEIGVLEQTRCLVPPAPFYR
jgi:hypothetical protein